MKHSLFVTGGTGFVGRELLSALEPGAYSRVVCLARRRPADSPLPQVQWIEGDLLQAGSYREALAGCTAVLHLAAATGKSTEAEFHRVNVEGTRALLSSCTNGQKFLYVSTIAARFRDQKHYYYAQSKAAAERLVASSGLPFTIVRPTIILGKGAPIVQALGGLAKAPVIPLFGDGKAVVQPVAAGDLIRAFACILETDRFRNEILELGGPERLSMEDLLQRMRRIAKGSNGAVLHLPVGPIRGVLAALEGVLGSKLPVTAGQLASFINDGAAEPNAFASLQVPTTPLDTTLRAALH